MTIKLWISGTCVPKARPRFYKGKALLPKRYRQWRHASETEIALQAHGISGLPIAKASIEVYLMGLHRGDADNLCGSVLDVLVAAGVLLDDRLSCVPRLVVEHQPDAKKRGIWVILEETWS